ncbi:hypothetical protein QZH41_017022 [Actinostola sp. cb2023]|nr:hypothetical protein QZH41_017022 [Actinostola sp. cb2023]
MVMMVQVVIVVVVVGDWMVVVVQWCMVMMVQVVIVVAVVFVDWMVVVVQWCMVMMVQVKEHFRNEFTPPRPLEGRQTSVRNTLKVKKKKRIIVGQGTELWVTDDEDDEDQQPSTIVKKLHTRYRLDASRQEMKEQVDDREPGTYSDNVHHLINNEHISYELDTTKAVNKYYQAAHPPEKSAFLANLENSKGYQFNQRPATAPQPNRPCSPTIHNMPSQLHEQTMTGSTSSDLYPKWFRQTSRYGPKRLSTALLELQDSWSRTEAHRKFHEKFPENAPDIRQKPDLRITTNERRHVIPETGVHVYYLHR